MWTSYRYCIGRHTYVTSMAHDIAKHYYDRLGTDRKEFTATDIRREIMDHLKRLPFKFEIHRVYNYDELNPLDVLFTFINEQNITSVDEFVKFSEIIYHSHENKFEFNPCEPTIKSYFSLSDLEDLLPWNDLASCFDEKQHKIIIIDADGEEVMYKCFKSWRRKTIPVSEDCYGIRTVRNAEFGWNPVWIPVDEYLKSEYGGYITTDIVKEVKDI